MLPDISHALVPFPTFMAVWVAYTLLGLPLLFGRNVARKQRYLRLYFVGAGVLFLAGMALTGFPLSLVGLMAPVVGLITWLNVRRVHFCPQCGTTVWGMVPFQKSRYCVQCGADLETGIAPPAA